MIRKGDIVLVSFPFTNLKGNKRRPAVILFVDELDVIAAFITSRIKNPKAFDFPIEPSKNNNLKKPSLIKIAKICTLDKNLIRGKLGELTSAEKVEINKRMVEIFAL